MRSQPLFRQEVALSTAEVTEAFSAAKVAAVSMATGGAVLFAGLLVLLASAVLALSLVVPHFVEGTIQTDLVITPDGEQIVTVDDLNVAQFMDLILENANIRNLIDSGKAGGPCSW